jgi:uncharacterized protein (DUF2249 family)
MERMVDLDLRGGSRERKEMRTLEGFHKLAVGESMDLVDDADPHHVLLRLQADVPAEFDWSPLELGPIWRVRIDRRDKGDGQRGVMEGMALDHDRLDALLQGARDAAVAGDWPAAHGRFRQFTTGLLRHIRMEEEVLFPAFEAQSGQAQGGPTAVMRDEHREIEAILRRIGDLLETTPGVGGRREPFDAGVGALLSVLGDHNVKEEEVLYPLTDQVLGPKEADALVRTMQRVR